MSESEHDGTQPSTDDQDGKEPTVESDGIQQTDGREEAQGVAAETTDDGETILQRTRPALTPTVLKLALLLLTVGIVVGLVTVAPSLVGGQQTANIVQVAAAIIAVVGIVGYLIRVYVLIRTEYIVTETGVRRQYELLFRQTHREVPYNRIRSHELDQSRTQYLLGFGSIALNQGLGTLVLGDVRDPHDTYQHIRDQLDDLS